jgi:hypothetical protein
LFAQWFRSVRSLRSVRSIRSVRSVHSVRYMQSVRSVPIIRSQLFLLPHRFFSAGAPSKGRQPNGLAPH